ncbi:MAG: hypothetical protein A3J69_01095 [Candidatus Levybacteria bacterium RIFCSPHIGHO2_02_FULL_42_12]|nr:MAG: hypothetical protein A3J69_01095 [Candidatus Levybacteria bacterium RIFCSPHIGHO2_02_FULL_42_12]
MKIVMVMVATLNGKITKRDDPDIYKWTSREDQTYFFFLLKKSRLIVMGSKTYEAAQKNIKLTNNTLRIVLTKNPMEYRKDFVPGKLEFTNELPRQLVKRLDARGYEKMLLVGGGVLNAAFLKAGLVNEVHLTLEPKIFGAGKPFVGDNEFECSLKLISIKRLNTQGTLLLRYKIGD